MNRIYFIITGIIFILLFQLSIILSYLNFDYSIKVIYLVLFVCLSAFLIIGYISLDQIYFINSNFLIVLIILIFSHTFLYFTVFPIKFGIEYDHQIGTAALFLLAITYLLFSNDKIKDKLDITFSEKIIFKLCIIVLFISIFLVNIREFTYLIAISKIIIFISSLYLFMLWVPNFLIRYSNYFRVFAKVLFVVGLISGFFGLLTVAIPDLNTINIYPGLSVSFFQHPNANAFLYCYTIPAGLFIMFSYNGKNKYLVNITILSLTFIIFINQVLTYSRSGIIAVLLASFIIFGYVYRKYILIILVVSIIGVTFLFNLTTEEKGASTVIGRYGLFTSGIQTLLSNNVKLLFGYGINDNFKQFENTKIDLLVTEPHNYPHNSIVFLSLEFGILFTFLVLSLFLKIIIQYAIFFFKSKLNLKIVFIFSVFVSVILQSFLEDYVLFPDYYMFHLFLIFAGLTYRYKCKINTSVKI